jgi:hypothetical protein
LGGLVVEATGLNDLVINVQLVPGTCIHRFLDTLFSDEAQNSNGLCLSDTVSTILCLKIGVRIPIAVETICK